MAPQAGDALPDVTLYEGNPGGKVSLRELFAGKKGIIFAVPGAFTPGCSKTHLPGYVASCDQLKAAGVDVVACVSVNDPFVMEAWGESAGAGGKVRMLGDMHLELTKAFGMELDAEPFLGNKRSKRYSVIVNNNTIEAFFEEPDGTGLSCSLAENALKALTK